MCAVMTFFCVVLGIKGATAPGDTIFFVTVVGVLFCFVTGSLCVGLKLGAHPPLPSPTRTAGEDHQD